MVGFSLYSDSFCYNTKNWRFGCNNKWERWEYEKLNGKLGELLENYFVRIHTELIDVVEE